MNYVEGVYSGRIGSITYFSGLMFLGVIFYASIFSIAFVSMPDMLANTFIYVLYILSFFYYVSLFVRRLHDLGKSGWHVLFLLIPLVNFYWGLVMLFKKGEETENKYGAYVDYKSAKFFKLVFTGIPN